VAASMLPANNTMQVEPMRLAMNASLCDCAPLRWHGTWQQSTIHHLEGGVRRSQRAMGQR
jgi:hypothetical protein